MVAAYRAQEQLKVWQPKATNHAAACVGQLWANVSQTIATFSPLASDVQPRRRSLVLTVALECGF